MYKSKSNSKTCSKTAKPTCATAVESQVPQWPGGPAGLQKVTAGVKVILDDAAPAWPIKALNAENAAQLLRNGLRTYAAGHQNNN